MWVSWCKNKSFWQRFTCTIDESIKGAASLRRYGITFDDNINKKYNTPPVTYVVPYKCFTKWIFIKSFHAVLPRNRNKKKQLLHYKVLLLNIYTVLVVHPNPTCFAMQSKAMIWKEPRQLHQRKARPIRLRKRNLSLNVLVQSAANACHRVFPYTYTRGPKLYIPSTINTWKRL